MSFVKTFFLRGFLSAWAGPVILAIIYAALNSSGVVSSVSVEKLFTAVISSVVMAFVAGGISEGKKSNPSLFTVFKRNIIPLLSTALIFTDI